MQKYAARSNSRMCVRSSATMASCRTGSTRRSSPPSSPTSCAAGDRSCAPPVPRTINLAPRLRAIVEQEYPRFSDAEYSRRHAALASVMAERGLDHLLVVTDHRSGNAPQWLTGWPGTVEAYVIFRPGEQMTMHVEWYNHFPLAKKLARDCDVRWGEHQALRKTIEELKRRGAKRVVLMGPLLFSKFQSLQESFQVVSLDSEYVRLRLI